VSTFNYVDWLSQEGLRMLLNELECSQFANTDYNKEFTKPYAIGETLRVNKPQRFNVTDGMGYQPQALDRPTTTVTVDQTFGIHFNMDDIDAALKMERGRAEIKKAYLDPAMAQIAQEIDSRFARFATLNANNIVGVLGTDPTSFQTVNQGRQRMVELACPSGDKGAIVTPAMNVALTNAAVAYFNPSKNISDQFREGYVGFNSGFKFYESMSLIDITAGTRSGSTNTISGAGQSGSSLLLGCTSGDTYFAGEVFSIASVYAVNPSTRQITNRATTKQFVITQDVTASASTVTVQISPAIVGPGSHYQNVDALPGAGATVTFWPGTSSPNAKSGKNGLLIHGDAFALVGVALEVPKAVEMSTQMRDPKTGIAVRFVRMFDPIQSRMVNRFDVLLGFGNLYPDNCCVRLLGA
jgi:hypothetical protein